MTDDGMTHSDDNPFAGGFTRQVAVVTGGGSGMGRELVRQLAADGCDVATCDVTEENVVATAEMCRRDGSAGEVFAHVADVSDESAVLGFRDAVASWRPHVNLLFNNAGVAGGGSVVDGDRDEWDKTFAVCWGGVYFGTRAFLPLLLAAEHGIVVNTSSINGFWASLGPGIPHSAYSSAKFAVKGFTEALIGDFRVNAPHLRAAVVMPGHIGTSIAINSSVLHGKDPKDLTTEQLAQTRERLARTGLDLSAVSDEDLRLGLRAQGEAFRDNAPMSAEEAARDILSAVRSGRWRILVGEDARLLDVAVRSDPESAYLPEFHQRLQQRGALGFGADG